MEVNKLEGKTLDGVSANISALAQAFPEAIVDGRVDFEKLRLLLGDDIEDAEERYNFTWPGKRDAIKLAISRTTGTLRPDKENSKDWDNTQNLFIEGDNLEVLRVLQNTYRGKVKMIYIDPPYNTGKDFVYKDDFKDNIANYKEQAGLEGQSNADTSGRYHTNWLNMMYPRLRLAKNLLRDDGVIFISIDDHEVHNLRRLCDELFGEENMLGQMVWHARGRSKTPLSVDHEYILCYARNIKNIISSFDKDVINGKKSATWLGEPIERAYSNPDNDKRGLWRDAQHTVTEVKAHYTYSISKNSGELKLDTVFNDSEWYGHQSWMYPPETIKALFKDNRLVFNHDENRGRLTLKVKRFQTEEVPFTSLSGLIQRSSISSRNGSEELLSVFKSNVFDYPKPSSLIKKFVQAATFKKNEIVIDFFAGSAPLSQAVMSLNAEDGGNRRFILVQLPEKLDDSNKKQKVAVRFCNKFNLPLKVSSLTLERIRRAGEIVKADFADKLKERATPLDIGFKAFKLDTTNFREWDTDTEDINASLLAVLDTFKEGRTSEDALYEVLLKYGVDLTEPVEVLTLDGKQVYSLAGNYLLVCLEKKITLATVEEMAKLNPSRVVCYDDGFETDEVKQNALETLKRAGVEDVRVI